MLQFNRKYAINTQDCITLLHQAHEVYYNQKMREIYALKTNQWWRTCAPSPKWPWECSSSCHTPKTPKRNSSATDVVPKPQEKTPMLLSSLLLSSQNFGMCKWFVLQCLSSMLSFSIHQPPSKQASHWSWRDSMETKRGTRREGGHAP